MSTDERNMPANKYWTNVDGERYLQVEEVDDQCFRDGDDDDDNAAAVADGDDNDNKDSTENGQISRRGSLL